MEWKIWYGDGSTFSSQDGDVTDAPALNVQIIVQHDQDIGRVNQTGADYYIQREGRWWGVDIFGLFDYLMECGTVKFGRTVDSRRFRQIFHQAETDPDFQARSGFRRGERRP